MDDRGLAGFILCKIGVALAATALIGAVFSMYAGFGRVSGREELERVADTIESAINTLDSLPGEVEMRRNLPELTRQFEVMMTGQRIDEGQIVRVRVIAETEVERLLVLSSEVNGGEFALAVKNPGEIRLTKSSSVLMELT